MKNTIQIISAFAVFLCFSIAQAQVSPSIQWGKSLGGSSDDEAFSLCKTIDGGFAVAGQTQSNDGDVSGNHGNYDYWVVKLDSSGSLLWQKPLGGSKDDVANSIQQTAEGGFILSGKSFSEDFDVTINQGSKDFWVVKLDTAGNIAWQKSFGGSNGEEALSAEQIIGGGFIVAGYSNSTDSDVVGNHGSKDYWILKLDTAGNILWAKSYGGSDQDFANDVQQTNDGGFIIAGSSESTDLDVTENHGQYDYWIVKLDSSGNILWEKSLGGTGDDQATSIRQTADNGFIVAGYSDSNNGDVSGNHGGTDYWIVKLDSAGTIIWGKSFGGSNYDAARSIRQSTDNGFIVAGETVSNDGNVAQNQGGYDYWILKLDSIANLTGQLSLGGSENDFAFSVLQTVDSGFVVAGYSLSQDGDVTGNHGIADYWVVKLVSEIPTEIISLTTPLISVYPNPVQGRLTVTFVTPATETTVRAYDLQGRMIDLPITFQSNSAQLNTSSLPAGFYILKILNDKNGDTNTMKFVKN